jgi:hypothetical protein
MATDEIPVQLGSLKQQLREATAEVQKLAEKFGATSAATIEAAKRAAELRDKIGDAKDMIAAFNPDAKFKSLTSSLSGVAGGFAAVQGAMGLFGNQTKDVEKMLLKVQSAMAISQGLQSVGESIDSFKQLGAVVSDTAKKAFGGLKAAIGGTGIGLLVIGLSLLIANFDSVKKAIMNLIPGLGKVADFIGGLVNAVTDFIGVTSEAGRATAKMIEDNEKAIKNGERFLELNGDKYDEYTQRKIKANLEYKKKYNEFQNDQTLKDKDRAIYIEQARAKADREIAKADEDREKKGDENRKKVQDKEDAANAKKLEKIKAAKELEETIESELTKTKLDARGKDLEDLKVNYEKKKEILIAGNQSIDELEKLYAAQKVEVNDKYDKEELKKAKDFQDALNDIKTKTANLGIVDKREQELQSIQDSYAKELLAIETNETYNAEQKLALKLAKLDEEQAAITKKNQEFANEDTKKVMDAGIGDIDRIANATKISLEDRRTAIIGSTKDLLDNFKGTAEERTAIVVASGDAINKVDEEISKEKVARKKSEVDAIAGALDVLGGIVDKGSIAGKGIAIAQAVMNTYQAATAALAASPPPFNFIAAAASVAAGLVNVSKIVSTKVPSAKGSGSIGGASAPSISSASAPLPPQLPQAQMTQLNQESINALGNQAIKAYVVETDMTTNQQRIAAIQQRARFG